MRRALRLVHGYTRLAFLQQFTWRGFLISIVLQHLVTPLLGLAVWSAALPGDPLVIRYYVAILAVQMMTVSYENHTFSNTIYDGTFTGALVKPQPVVIETVGTSISIHIWHLLFAIPITALVSVILGARFGVEQVLIAVPALVFAASLRFLFTYLLSLSAFFTQRAHGVVGLGETLIFLLGGVAAPLTLFPSAFRGLAEALPFGAMLGFPAELASGAVHGYQLLTGYVLQVLWIATFVLLTSLAWRAGVRRYTAVGG